jgi:hypothetical protein
MRFTARREFLLSLFGTAAAAAADKVVPYPPQGLTVAGGKRTFRIFDGLLYATMPDLRALGMPKLRDAGSIWGPKVPHTDVDPAGIAAAVRVVERLTNTYYFDLEEWTVSNAPLAVINANIDKLARVAQIARQTAPQAKFGFYDQAPRGDYWPIVLNRTSDLEQWHAINKRSASIAANVDYVLPSLYTFYDDVPGWKKSSGAVLEEARQYGKPVYPFLWPRFHNSNTTLKMAFVPRDFWRQQLEFCRDHADGLVLWGGYKETWDENAPWWEETRAFAVAMGIQAQS